jgi:Ca-activated chloride channel homolog
MTKWQQTTQAKTTSKRTAMPVWGWLGRFGGSVLLLLAVAACQDLAAGTPTRLQVNGYVVERTAQGTPTGRVEFGVSAFDAGGTIVDRAAIRSVSASLDPVAQGVDGAALGAGDATFDAAAIVVTGSVCGDVTPGSGSLAAVLMIDESGSMYQYDPGKLRHQAGQRFVASLRGADVVAVARFPAPGNPSPGLRASRVTSDFTATRQTAAAAVAATPHAYGTFTPLWDAANDGVFLLNGRRERNRVLVVLTDGENNASRSTSAEVNAYARNQGVRVFAVGFGTARAQELDALVVGTGGYREIMNPANPTSTIENLLDNVYAATQAQGCVALRFSPTPREGTRLQGTLQVAFDGVTLTERFDVLF